MKVTVVGITKDGKGVGPSGKLYYYSELVVSNENNENKTYKIFNKDIREVVAGLKPGDTTYLTLEKNTKGYWEITQVGKASTVDVKERYSSPNTPTTERTTTSYSQKDVEIEVMNALNVASSSPYKTTEELLTRTREILNAKSSLIEYAKALRDGVKPDVSEDIYAGIK